MKPRWPFALFVLMFTVVANSQLPPEQPPDPSARPIETAANPEMERLASVLEGKWETTETMERGKEFPDGGSRHGFVHARLAAGGTTLLYEVHSFGTAGKLDGFLAIWWDKTAQGYLLFACFNGSHPCAPRGTAHWENDTFVNDYELGSGENKTHWRDSFTFTRSTHTLVAAIDAGKGVMKTEITTKATRYEPPGRPADH